MRRDPATSATIASIERLRGDGVRCSTVRADAAVRHVGCRRVLQCDARRVASPGRQLPAHLHGCAASRRGRRRRRCPQQPRRHHPHVRGSPIPPRVCDRMAAAPPIGRAAADSSTCFSGAPSSVGTPRRRAPSTSRSPGSATVAISEIVAARPAHRAQGGRSRSSAPGSSSTAPRPVPSGLSVTTTATPRVCGDVDPSRKLTAVLIRSAAAVPASGSSATTCVPPPGGDTTARRPPRAATRSASPTSPDPPDVRASTPVVLDAEAHDPVRRSERDTDRCVPRRA